MITPSKTIHSARAKIAKHPNGTDEERQIELYRTLMEITQAINASLDLEDVLLMVRNAAIDFGGFDRAGVWMMAGEQILGAWGTDAQGRLRDERHLTQTLAGWSSSVQELRSGASRYYIEKWPSEDLPNATQIEDLIHAVVGLIANGELVGLLSVDNLITARPISEADMQPLLLLAEPAAIAIKNSRLTRERELMLTRQRRLMEISAGINASLELDEILRLVRDAVVEAGGFDRAGVYRVERGMAYGAWGTDCLGNPRCEHEIVRPVSALRGSKAKGERLLYRIAEGYTEEGSGLTEPVFRKYAIVELVADGKLVGMLFADNLITGRPFSEQDIKALMPFTEQAVVAIQNAKLLRERSIYLERQRRLAGLAAAIGASTALEEILRMFQEAVVGACGFDRAGVYLYDDRNKTLIGTWGTDRDGRTIREDSIALPVILTGNTPLARLIRGEAAFILTPDFTEHYRLTPDHVMYGVHAHAMVAIRAGGEILGRLSVDNLLTNRPITDEDVRILVSFADQIGVAIYNVRLLDERRISLERQQRLANLAAAITSSTALNDILRMVRDAIAEAGGFDRAAVLLVDRITGKVDGAWGTDRQGHAVDISAVHFTAEEIMLTPAASVINGEVEYSLSDDLALQYSFPSDHPLFGVHSHATIPLRSSGDIVGFLSVDNLMTDRPISVSDVSGLLPFANQAAVAIQNARLFQELRQTQDALIRSEKMRAIGELASGVAHNMNNVLTAVLGYSELIQHDEKTSDTTRRHASIIERAALDGAEITRRLQQTARHENASGMNAFDLSSAVQEALDLAFPILSAVMASKGIHIDVTSTLEPGVIVSGVASEIREVAVNLIRNALDAMPNGGSLTIDCLSADGSAHLQVTDTGMGMDDATRRRVFEPFFTTKGTTLGLGLGLSVAWGIIDRHHGQVDVASAIGQGTTFHVRLPLAKPCPETEATLKHANALNGLRVLVVEDEQLVANGLAGLLAAIGATVDIAPDAAQAIDWLCCHSSRCDVILSDHGMAGMTGIELLKHIRDLYPHIRRVLISGWGTNLPGIGKVDSAEMILSKPVRIEDLAVALRKFARNG